MANLFHTPYAQAALRFDGVSVHRGNTCLFDSLSLELTNGQVLWVQGANGIGKTSLLKCATGLSKPDSGQVMWDLNKQSVSPQTVIAYQGHKDALKPNLTPRQDLEFWKDIYDYPGSIEDILKRVRLLDKHIVAARNLSAGQRRRLAVAHLILSQKPIWVMDEPAAAMDVHGRQLIYDIISEHSNHGGIVMLASHEAAQPLGSDNLRLRLDPPIEANQDG